MEEYVRGLDRKGRHHVAGGQGQGIGRALTLRLGRKAVRSQSSTSAWRRAKKPLLAGDSAIVRTWQLDVSDLPAVQAAVEAVEAELGPNWTLVNNAGWDRPAPFLKPRPILGRKSWRSI